MPKYWVKNYFAHGRFPEVGQKQKTEKERKRERAKVGVNNGQAMHGARKHAWCTQAAWAKMFLKIDKFTYVPRDPGFQFFPGLISITQKCMQRSRFISKCEK